METNLEGKLNSKQTLRAMGSIYSYPRYNTRVISHDQTSLWTSEKLNER